MSTIPTNRESDRFMLRLPDGMRDRIKAAAEVNNRSMNAEIVSRLEYSLAGDDFAQSLPLPEAFDELASRSEVLARHIADELIKRGFILSGGSGEADEKS